MGTSYYGTASIYFDGRRNPNPLTGWTLNGNFCDFGRIGILLSGGTFGNYPSVFGISIGGCCFTAPTRCVHIECATNVTVNGLVLGGTSSQAELDGISATAGVYVSAGIDTNAIARGITVVNSNLGQTRDFTDFDLANAYAYGLLLDGASIQDLVVEGNNICGRTLPVATLNNAASSGSRWKIEKNICAYGTTLPWPSNVVVPTVSSGSTVTLLSGHDIQKITGSTAISTINEAWLARDVTLLIQDGVQFLATGNLATAFYARANSSVRLAFDGSKWWPTALTAGGGGVGALVRLSSAQLISNGTTTAINWSSSVYNDLSIWNSGSNQSRLTVPTGVTKVRVAIGISWDSNNTGDRYISIWKNGSEYGPNHRKTADFYSETAFTSPVLTVQGGDYFEMRVAQSSGGSLNALQFGALPMGTFMMMEIVA